MRLRSLILLEAVWWLVYYFAALWVTGSFVLRAGDFLVVVPRDLIVFVGYLVVARWLWDHERGYRLEQQRQAEHRARMAKMDAESAAFRAEMLKTAEQREARIHQIAHFSRSGVTVSTEADQPETAGS